MLDRGRACRALRALLLAAALAAIAAPPAMAALRVRGNQLVDGPGRGHVVQLRGVNRSGVEYACINAPAYRAAGMQSLANAVRSTGATQPLLLGGLGFASDLSGWNANAPRDPRHQLIAAEHNYGGLSPCAAGCRAAVLQTHRRHPVVFGELGETDCRHGYIGQMMGFADRYGIGYLGWSWDATSPGGWNCARSPALITSYTGTPTAYGVGLRNHLLQLGPPEAPPALP